MKKWVNVKDVSELRMGDRVRFTDYEAAFEDGTAVGDDGDENDWRYVCANRRVAARNDQFGGYTPENLMQMWTHVQVLRNVSPEPGDALDALKAVHEVLHDVPEYAAFVTLKDGRNVQVRGMVIAAIEKLEGEKK